MEWCIICCKAFLECHAMTEKMEQNNIRTMPQRTVIAFVAGIWGLELCVVNGEKQQGICIYLYIQYIYVHNPRCDVLNVDISSHNIHIGSPWLLYLLFLVDAPSDVSKESCWYFCFGVSIQKNAKDTSRLIEYKFYVEILSDAVIHAKHCNQQKLTFFVFF